MARQTVHDLVARARTRIGRVDAHGARAAVERGALLIDIRGDAERARDGAVPGARHVPREALEWRADPDSGEAEPDVAQLDRELVVMSGGGGQSSLAAAALVELGHTGVSDLEGGFRAWKAAGLPVEEPPTGERDSWREFAAAHRPALIRVAVLAAVVGAIAFAAAVTGAQLSPERIRAEGDSLGAWGLVLYLPLTVLLSSAGIPSPIIAGGAGLLFGTLVGAGVAHLGIVLAACAQLLITRRFSGEDAGTLVPARLRRLDDFLARRGFFAVLYYRLVPGLPFMSFNYASGLTRLRVRDMFLGTAIGKAPRTWAYAALGGNLDDLGSSEARIAIAILVAMAIGGGLLALRELRAERAERARSREAVQLAA